MEDVCLEGVTPPKPVLTVRLDPQTQEDERKLEEALRVLLVEDPSLAVRGEDEEGEVRNSKSEARRDGTAVRQARWYDSTPWQSRKGVLCTILDDSTTTRPLLPPVTIAIAAWRTRSAAQRAGRTSRRGYRG